MATDEEAEHGAAASGELDLKKKSREWKQQIVSVNRHEFREWFGVRSADKWGSFVDCNLSAIVHSYADWAGYPRGKHTVMEGREGTQLYTLVISSNGYHLFTAMKDGHIAVWDLTENREIGAWKAHEGYVRCLDYHCSGVLVSSGADNSIRIWDAHTVALILSIEDHTDWINSVAISKDGNRVISGSYNASIRLWSMETGECLRQFLGHSQTVLKVRFVDEVIVSIADDSYLKLWESSDSEAYLSIGEPGESMNDISVNCDYSLMLLIRDWLPILYSWPNMNIIRRIDADAFLCCFHPCDPSLIALNTFDEENQEDGNTDSIKIYDVRNRECVLTLGSCFPNVIDLCFTPDGTRLVWNCYPSTMHIWDVSSLLSS